MCSTSYSNTFLIISWRIVSVNDRGQKCQSCLVKKISILFKQRVLAAAFDSHHFAYPWQPILFNSQRHSSLTQSHVVWRLTVSENKDIGTPALFARTLVQTSSNLWSLRTSKELKTVMLSLTTEHFRRRKIIFLLLALSVRPYSSCSVHCFSVLK